MSVERLGDAVLYLGDCREIMSELSFDALISDPPWGSNTACKRFRRRASPWWQNIDNSKVTAHRQIQGDDKPFDPRPFLYQKTILWGANWFAQHLPPSGGWLIWDKRKGVETMADKGWSLGEAELAWTNLRNSTRVFRNLWSGLLRSSEKGEFHHPTQKPVALIEWCLAQAGYPQVTCDPFMGSGTTGVACAKLGLGFIGVEIDEAYFSIACKRIEAELRQGKLAI
jgi:site-specific DNA-methyltransferase (adenine-specific)/modification methylase